MCYAGLSPRTLLQPFCSHHYQLATSPTRLLICASGRSGPRQCWHTGNPNLHVFDIRIATAGFRDRTAFSHASPTRRQTTRVSSRASVITLLTIPPGRDTRAYQCRAPIGTTARRAAHVGMLRATVAGCRSGPVGSRNTVLSCFCRYGRSCLCSVCFTTSRKCAVGARKNSPFGVKKAIRIIGDDLMRS